MLGLVAEKAAGDQLGGHGLSGIGELKGVEISEEVRGGLHGVVGLWTMKEANRIEQWFVMAGCMFQKLTCVPFWNKIRKDTFELIVEETAMTTICVSGSQELNKIRGWKDHNKNYALRSLQNIIIFDEADLSTTELNLTGKDCHGLKIFLFSNIISDGQLQKAKGSSCP